MDTGASSFTHNGQFFALVSVDGRLRIWDTTSGKLIQEFSPSSHVESSCTCVCWTREKRAKKDERKSRRKNVKSKVVEGELISLVLGTNNGTVLTYDPVAGEAENQFTDGHDSSINCVLYGKTKDTVYTCSNDKYIVEWSYNTQDIISKWKADKISVKMMCLGPNEETLLSAGRSIKLWNLETKELLQRFNGHSSSVSLLRLSSFQSCNDTALGMDGHYFFSGSTEDRVINAWHVNLSRPEKTSIASFMLSDVPVFLHSLSSQEEKQLKLCVGCRGGRIHFFINTLNGRMSRPIESTKTLELLSKDSEERSNATPMNFLNARLYDNDNLTLMLITGTSITPSFKKFVYSKLDVKSKIIEELSKNILLSEVIKDDDSTIKLANQNTQAKLIGSTTFLPKLRSKPDIVIDVNGNEQDLQKTEGLEDEISMEERLKAFTPKTNIKLKPTKSIPSAASFSQMLIQGLHSSDDSLIHEVLFKSYPKDVLKNTIRRIPNNLIGTLISIVVNKLQQNPARSKDLSSWLGIIMSVHLTYLMTKENLTGSLSNLYRLLKSQQEIHPLMLNVQGKIDLLFSHAATNNLGSSDEEDILSAAVLYNDDSDEENETPLNRNNETDEELDIAEIADCGLDNGNVEASDEDSEEESVSDDTDSEDDKNNSDDDSDQY